MLAGAVTGVAIWLVVRAVRRIFAVVRLGQPDPERFERKPARTRTMLTETLGHTRMLKWTWVGAAHWFVMIAFIFLSSLVLEAYFEVVTPQGELPIIGHWGAFGLFTEIVGVLGIPAILYLMVLRLINRPGRRPERKSRFVGSTMWQAYFVEWVVLVVLLLGMSIRGFKAANGDLPWPVWAAPVSHALGNVLPASESAVSLARPAEDRGLDDVGHRDRAQCDHGRGVAPVPRLPEHLLQAQWQRQGPCARCAAADDERG